MIGPAIALGLLGRWALGLAVGLAIALVVVILNDDQQRLGPT